MKKMSLKLFGLFDSEIYMYALHGVNGARDTMMYDICLSNQ